MTVDETDPAAGEAAEEAVAEAAEEAAEEAVAEAAEDVDVSGGRAAVAACAGRENNSTIAKPPAQPASPREQRDAPSAA